MKNWQGLQVHDSQTRLLGIIGNPLGHSLSPTMHKYLLNGIGQKGSYDTFEIEGNCLAETIDGMKANGFLGVNVTIPYKQAIMRRLDEVDEEADFIGAVNTVLFQKDKLLGFNTDGQGFISALKRRNVHIENCSAIVLGAGGAARAAIFNLIRCGAKKLFIFNRTSQRAQNLASEVRETFRSVEVDFGNLDTKIISSTLKSCDLIINTTSLGMWPGNNKTPYSFVEDGSDLVAIDLIYNPLQTKFLQYAQKSGAKTVDGLDMFIFQGVASLKIWLDKDIEFDHQRLRNYLSKELEKYELN